MKSPHTFLTFFILLILHQSFSTTSLPYHPQSNPSTPFTIPSALHPKIRQLTPPDLKTTYTLLQTTSSRSTCPTQITHNAITQSSDTETLYEISHRDILHDDIPCTSQGLITLTPSTSSEADVIPIKGLKGHDYVQGIESDGSRICGNSRVEGGTIIVWVRDDEKDIDIGLKGVPTLKKGLEYMVFLAMDCIYVREEIEGTESVGRQDEEDDEELAEEEVEEVEGSPDEDEEDEDEDDEDEDEDEGMDEVGGDTQEELDEDVEGIETGDDLGDLSGSSSDADNESDGGGKCFPGTALVTMKDASVKLMRDVQVGNEVLVSIDEGLRRYSKVFMFTHRVDDGKLRDYIQIDSEDGQKVVLTKGHYLYVNGNLAAAESVRIGDIVQVACHAEERWRKVVVSDVSCVQSKSGLYNPQTMHGDIVVNSIRASTYTTAIEPRLAHTLLSPLRGMFVLFGVDPSGDSLSNGWKSIPQWLPKRRLAYM